MADSRTEVYRDGKVHVRADQCDHCLLSKDRLVDGDRARQLLADTRATDGSAFICHRSDVADTKPAICAAWWDRFSDEDWIMRLAKIQGIVDRVAE